MAKISMDGNTRVAFVPAIADISAPKIAELDATGVVDLSCKLTPDGLDISYNEASKDVSLFCSTQNSAEPGRTDAAIVLKYFRFDSPTENVAEVTLVHKLAGFLVVRPAKDHNTAFAAADKVRVYTVTCGEQRDVKVAPNMDEQIEQTLFNSGDYNRNAVVAA